MKVGPFSWSVSQRAYDRPPWPRCLCFADGIPLAFMASFDPNLGSTGFHAIAQKLNVLVEAQIGTKSLPDSLLDAPHWTCFFQVSREGLFAWGKDAGCDSFQCFSGVFHIAAQSMLGVWVWLHGVPRGDERDDAEFRVSAVADAQFQIRMLKLKPRCPIWRMNYRVFFCIEAEVSECCVDCAVFLLPPFRQGSQIAFRKPRAGPRHAFFHFGWGPSPSRHLDSVEITESAKMELENGHWLGSEGRKWRLFRLGSARNFVLLH